MEEDLSLAFDNRRKEAEESEAHMWINLTSPFWDRILWL